MQESQHGGGRGGRGEKDRLGIGTQVGGVNEELSWRGHLILWDFVRREDEEGEIT